MKILNSHPYSCNGVIHNPHCCVCGQSPNHENHQAATRDEQVRQAEQHLEKTKRQFSQDPWWCADESTVIQAEEKLRKIRGY